MACGACVLSNEVPGLQSLFQDSIVTYRGAKDFNRKVQWLLHDEHAREKIGEAARQKILAHHTWGHRAVAFKNMISRQLIQ
jgi:spore maturation protein CgeB